MRQLCAAKPKDVHVAFKHNQPLGRLSAARAATILRELELRLMSINSELEDQRRQVAIELSSPLTTVEERDGPERSNLV